MSTTFAESKPAAAATYGGVIDAIGGIATAVIAIVGLTGFQPDVMAAIATVVFGAALLIEGGTLLSEYAAVLPLVGSGEQVGDGGVSVMFLAGVSGIVLGVLALLNIAAAALVSISVIVFGATLVLSSSSVRHLYRLQWLARRASTRSGAELLAGEMASGSAGVHVLTGLAASVLGILAVCGARTPVLMLSALLIMGVAFILTGSSLSGLVMSFMRQESTTSTTTRTAL